MTTGRVNLELTERADVAARGAALSRHLILALYSLTIFVGASLVFLVQPMVTRMILPAFGGSPSVWNTAMVFFQAILLAGYCYAHVSYRMLGPRRQPVVHLALLLLPLLVLPIAIPSSLLDIGSTAPALQVLLILGATVALPYFFVTTASPLIQRWFAQVDHPSARDPYFLYVASNIGSLLVLVSYPFLVEPYFTITEQTRMWAGAYIVFVVLAAACVGVLMRYPARQPVEEVAETVVQPADRPSVKERATWVLLAFIPSSLMIGVTTHLATDVASFPLLWIIPLATYLLTFIIAFARPQVGSSKVLGITLVLLAVASQVIAFQIMPVALSVVVHTAFLLTAGVVMHGRLAARRPAPVHLTEFYVLMSLGGVLGGVFNSLIAPVVFPTVIEYPLIAVLTVMIWIAGRFSNGVAGIAARRRQMVFRSVCAVALVSMVAISFIGSSQTLYSHRSFFGVLQVRERSDNIHVVVHGTTLHGTQDMTSEASRRTPISYYGVEGPLGQAFEQLQVGKPFGEVAAIGLGAGAVAAYGQEGQTLTFYEIDPDIVSVASNPRYFTYIEDSAASIEMVVGDGRLKIEEAREGQFDFLVMDAFSSDSIPVHLITVEAVEMYFDRLADDGVAAFHISNRHLDLAPVLAAISSELGLHGIHQTHIPSAEAEAANVVPSHWVLLSRDADRLAPLAVDGQWDDLAGQPSTSVWTDDFSNIVSTIRWFR